MDLKNWLVRLFVGSKPAEKVVLSAKAERTYAACEAERWATGLSFAPMGETEEQRVVRLREADQWWKIVEEEDKKIL